MKNRLRIISVIIFLSGGLQTLHAQLNPANLTHYTEMDGNNIFDVLADQFGNIWMTTHNGLVRFDGYEFTRYYNDPNDQGSISIILVNSLFEDSRGRIWIGGMNEINVFDPKTNAFRAFPFGHLTGITESGQPAVVTITEDQSGRLYFGAHSYYGFDLTNSLFSFDEYTETIQIVKSAGIQSVSNITDSSTDPAGNSWFIGRNGIQRINREGTLQPIAPLPGVDLTGNMGDGYVVASDQNGDIWMASHLSNIHVYDSGNEHFTKLDVSGIPEVNNRDIGISEIHFDEQNTPWLATSVGLIGYSRDSGQWITFADGPVNRFDETFVFSLDSDTFGNIWLGTWQHGLIKYENKLIFNAYKEGDGIDGKLTGGWAYRIV